MNQREKENDLLYKATLAMLDPNATEQERQTALMVAQALLAMGEGRPIQTTVPAVFGPKWSSGDKPIPVTGSGH